MQTALVAAALVASGGSLAQEPGPDAGELGTRWRSRVQAISGGEGSPGRAEVVAAQLDRLKWAFSRKEFQAGERKGVNLVVDYVGAPEKKRLLIGAHYDRVRQGTGAVDNASSCGALLELLERLRAKPLENFRVGAAFFDLEEQGLLGSRAMAADKDQRPDVFINMDIFAYGDTLWVMSPKPEGPLSTAFQAGARDFPMKVTDKYPPSDHRPFISAGVPTLSVSLIDGEEIQPTIDLLFGGRRGGQLPRIFTIIHTPGDGLDKLKPAQVAAGIPVLERCIRSLDARHR